MIEPAGLDKAATKLLQASVRDGLALLQAVRLDDGPAVEHVASTMDDPRLTAVVLAGWLHQLAGPALPEMINAFRQLHPDLTGD